MDFEWIAFLAVAAAMQAIPGLRLRRILHKHCGVFL